MSWRAPKGWRGLCRSRPGCLCRRKIEIRLFPDLDTFRNATGAPGTVAGQTRGSRIDLQPVSALRSRGLFDSTLRHELLHVLVENRVQPGVSVTEREQMVRELERQMR